jgi:hypothetical protein
VVFILLDEIRIVGGERMECEISIRGVFEENTGYVLFENGYSSKNAPPQYFQEKTTSKHPHKCYLYQILLFFL